MKCQECEPLLEQFLDGELDEPRAERVRAHAADCQPCAEALDTLAAEQSLYASYERDVEVTPQLWAGIEERIGARPQAQTERGAGLFGRLSGWLAPLVTAPRFSPALTAALVLVAVFGTIGAMKFLDSRAGGGPLAGGDGGRGYQPPTIINNNGSDPNAKGGQPTAEEFSSSRASAGQSTAAPSSADGARDAHEAESSSPAGVQPTPSAERGQKLAAGGSSSKKGIKERLSPAAALSGAQVANAARKGEPSPDQLVREAERRYLAAIRILERDVRGRQSRLDSRTLARFNETLASIDRTIAETRKAVRQQSNDPVAVQYMLSAYAKKVEVMREMAHLQQGN